MSADVTSVATKHYPRRDDPVAAWLKEQRDRYARFRYLGNSGGGAYNALDDLLDDYRLHSDLGVALGDNDAEPH